MTSHLNIIGSSTIANTTLELDLSTFDFSSVTNYTNIFMGIRNTDKIWVKDATAQSWVIARHNNLTTANVLIKES